MADSKRVELILGVRSEGAEKTAQDVLTIAGGATTLQRELGKISRGDQIARIGVEMANLAKKTKDVGGAVAELNKQLKELGASDDEIRDAANAFSAAQGGGPSNRLGRIGSELRALPSTQIPGLSISSDQIAGLIRLGGAIGAISDKAGEATKIGAALTPVLGQTAAGFAGMAVAAAPFVIAAVAVIGALKALGDQAAKETERINAIVEAQRDVGQDIARGLTTDEAKKERDELIKLQKDEQGTLARLNREYDQNINSAGALSGVLKIASGAEEGLAQQITKSTSLSDGYQTKIDSLNRAIENGETAANDAAIAEQKLAEERSKAALASADSAGKELQAQQKALNATEDQNLKRLDTIKDEEAVLQKQIDTLEESGVTSEEVTAKIAALKESLGLLGKESDFINKTALEASRAADAEKKAKKDAEDAAKKAQQAQEQYTKAVQGANTTYKQSVQDIGTRLKQTLEDSTTDFNRDLIGLTVKYRQDEFNLTVKANRAERDALQDQLNDIEKIREDARKDEQQAIQDGDFKALFLARQNAAETLAEEQKVLDQSALKRTQADRDAREDLLRAFDQQRQARRQGYLYQQADATTAQQRELQQARLTKQRALQVAAEGMNAELAMKQQFYNTSIGMLQQAIGQAQGIGARVGRDALRGSQTQAFSFAASMGQVVRR